MFPTQFTGASFTWEQVKLEKIATFSKGKGYSKLDLKRKGYPIFLYGQMYTDYRYKIVETSTYAILKEDAVVSNGNEIVIPSSGETSVDIARASWIAQKGIILGSDLNIIRPTSSVYPLFLALSLSNNQVKYNLAKVAQGNSIVHLYNNNLKKVNIYFPNIVEQNKIGNILNSISNCINLHERKCEELTLIKKALLQKLFPKKEEVRPEVRYKNFSDAWEQRKLGEVMDVGSVKRIHQSDWKTEGVRFLRARDIVSFSKNEKPSDLLYIDNSKYNEYSKISGKVQKGDLLVTGVGSIGVPMLIKSDDPIYFKDGNIIWFKNNNSLNGNFFYYSFTSNKIQNFIRKSSGAGTVGTYTIDNGKKTPILIPKDIDEQEKVGKFLSRFDALITLHQRKLEKLKQLKKFLLQNMFI